MKGIEVNVEQGELKRLFDKTAFSMAVQDVRFYLTGTLLEIGESLLKAVTTDGHRMAICETVIESNTPGIQKVIIPRKGVNEIQRLMTAQNKKIKLYFTNEFLHAEIDQTTKDGEEFTVFLTTKLIDGKYPDYARVIPIGNDKKSLIPLIDFKDCLARVAILSNEKIKGIILTFEPGELLLAARNPEQDEATETLAIDYEDDPLEISFNAQYLIDVLANIGHSEVELQMATENKSILVKNPSDSTLTYVVMPMRA
jgi:DNA polymerase-3 subunit beta